MLYVASGGSEDTAYVIIDIFKIYNRWVYYLDSDFSIYKINFGIKWSYCLELRPGQSNDPDSGFGFQLPEDRLK